MSVDIHFSVLKNIIGQRITKSFPDVYSLTGEVVMEGVVKSYENYLYLVEYSDKYVEEINEEELISLLEPTLSVGEISNAIQRASDDDWKRDRPSPLRVIDTSLEISCSDDSDNESLICMPERKLKNNEIINKNKIEDRLVGRLFAKNFENNTYHVA